MIQENYPQGYVGSISPISTVQTTTDTKPVASNVVVKNVDPNAELSRQIEREIKSLIKASATATPTAAAAIDSRLEDLYTAQRNLASSGSATYSVKGIESSTVSSSISTSKVLEPFSSQSTASKLGLVKSSSDGLYLPIDSFPYKGVSPEIYSRASDGFVKTGYAIQPSYARELESKSYSSTVQTSVGNSFKPSSEVQPSSKTFGTSTPLYDIQKGTGISVPSSVGGNVVESYGTYSLIAPVTVVKGAIGIIQMGGRTVSKGIYDVVPGSYVGGPTLTTGGNVVESSIAIPSASAVDVITTVVTVGSLGAGGIATRELSRGIVAGASILGLVSEAKNVPKIKTVYEAGTTITNVALYSYGTQAKSMLSRLGDTKYVSSMQLEGPVKYGVVIEPQFRTVGESPLSRSTVADNMQVVKTVSPTVESPKYVSALEEGGFKIESVGYISTAASLSDVTLGKRTFVSTTTLTGETSLIPKKGFLAEKGVQLDFVPRENPLLSYGQQRLVIDSPKIVLKDIATSSTYAYKEGSIVNLPTQITSRGDTFITYGEFSRFLPVKFGELIVDNKVQNVESISGFKFISQEGRIVTPSYKGEGFIAFEPISELSISKSSVPKYQSKLGSFFGEVPESNALIVKPSIISKPSVPFSYATDIKFVSFRTGVSDVYATESSKGNLRTELKLEGIKVPFDTIALGKISSPYEPKITYINSIYANDKAFGDKISISDFDTEIKVDKSLASKVFGARDYSFERVSVPSFDTKVSTTRTVVPSFRSKKDLGSESTSLFKQDLDTGFKLGFDNAKVSVQEPVQKSSQTFDTKSVQLQESKQFQDSKLGLMNTSSIMSASSTPQKITPTSTKVFEIFSPFDATKSFKPLIPLGIPFKDKKKSRFVVEVRRRGKFSKVGEFADLSQATEKGLKEVKSSAAASFRIKSTEGQNVFVQTPFGYGRSKKDFNVIVQPREQRISSFGEKQEISRKGQDVLRLGGGFKGGYL